VRVIKIQIKKRPNGQKLLKITNLTATPFFSIILQHMYNLQLKNYSMGDLEEKFEEMVEDWLTSSLLLKGEQSAETVKEFCDKQIANEKRQFFILGMKSVAKTVEEEINQLIESNYFEARNYEYNIKKRDDPKRIEVTLYSKNEP